MNKVQDFYPIGNNNSFFNSNKEKQEVCNIKEAFKYSIGQWQLKKRINKLINKLQDET